MSTALEPVSDGDELFLDGLGALKWISDVTEYRCTRCRKVLVQHYIANCQHKFCDNCKRLVDDGSQKWKCPKCEEFITTVERQDPEFKNKVVNLRLHCPNCKYGCEHICSFKQLKEHFKRCEHTRERALPVPYTGPLTFEMLDRLFAVEMQEMRKEMKEVKQKATELENTLNARNAEFENVHGSVWELSVEIDKIKKATIQMEKRQNDGENKLAADALNINYRIDGVISDLNVETTRLKTDVSDLQKHIKSTPKSMSLAVEENKSRIIKLEGKSESYLEMIEFNNRKLNERITKEFKNELQSKTMEIQSELIEKFERMMNENALLQERKWAEFKEKVIHIIQQKEEEDERENKEKMKSSASQNASHILFLNEQIKKLDRDLEDLRNQVLGPLPAIINETFETTSLTLNEAQKSTNEMKKEKNNEQLLEDGRKWADVSSRPSNLLEVVSNINKPEKTDHFQIINEYYKEEADFTWIVTGITSFLNGSQKELLGPVFPLRGYPFGAQGRLRLFAEEVWFDLFYKDINQTNKPAKIQLIPNIFVTLRDRQSKIIYEEREDIVNVYCFPYAKKLKYDTMYDFYLPNVKRKILNSPRPYAVDDEVALTIHVEAPEVAQLVHSHDGILSWAIDEFRRRKQREVDGLIKSTLSPYFYSGITGYRVHVKAYLNGYDTFENKGLSLQISFLTGLYDDTHDSTKNFRGKATLNIIHNLHSSLTINKTVETESGSWTTINVGTHKQIDQLLQNDTLNCRVTIEANDVL